MSRSRFTRILASAGAGIVALGGLVGCVGQPGGIQAPDSWTILHYSIADTNLEPFMMEDIEEMGKVGSQPGFNLVAFVDRAEGYTDTPVLGIDDWTGAKWLEIGKGEATILDEWGEVNTGDPALLADFIRESIIRYPAANYALIISDHGSSWPGVGGDESADHDTLTLSELAQGISAGLEGAGVDKLDLVGFDACLMATFEVASTLAPYADRLLASQELEPGHGWDYTALEAAYRGADVDTLGSAIIDGFRKQALAWGTETDITLSLVDLENFGVVDTAVTELADALIERVADVAPAIGRTIAQTLGFGSNPDPRYDLHMKDLGIFAGEISVRAVDVADEAEAVVRAVNDVVLDKVDGQATRGATGLSIYFPPTTGYYDPAYNAVAERTGWAEFLTTYYGQGQQIDPGDVPSFVDGDAQVEFADGGVYIIGSFGAAAEDSIAVSKLYYGVLSDNGSVTYIGDRPAQVSTDGSGVAGAYYNLGYLLLSDGEDASIAYMSLRQDAAAGTASVSVPLYYYAPSGGQPLDALLELTLDPGTGSILSETYYAYNQSAGSYGELSVDPNGLIAPLVEYLAPGSTELEWIEASENGLKADLTRLDYSVQGLPSGTRVVLELWVWDYGGNGDYVSTVITIP